MSKKISTLSTAAETAHAMLIAAIDAAAFPSEYAPIPDDEMVAVLASVADYCKEQIAIIESTD
jgi:hypothetical protein